MKTMRATPPVDAPVQLVVELRVRPGAQDRARESLARLVSATHREDDGCVRFEVGVDELDDTRFVGYEVWASQDALNRHSNQPHTQAFLEEARAFATDPDAPLTVSRWLPLDALRAADYRPRPTRTSTPARPPAGFEHRDADVGGVRLHYVIGGAGDPVVLLHGFPNSWYAWRDVMPALGARHTVLAVDLRGLGDSDRPGHGYDMQATSQDIAGLVDQLGLGPVFLAGQDWGGSTAFALTAAHPERVRALAVLEAMPSGPWSGQDAKAGPWFAAFHRIHGLPETLVAGREDDYLAWFYEAFSATPGVPTAAAVDEYLRTYSAPERCTPRSSDTAACQRRSATTASPARRRSPSRSSRSAASISSARRSPRTFAPRRPTSARWSCRGARTTSPRNAPTTSRSSCSTSSPAANQGRSEARDVRRTRPARG